jgi:hypothetical protein
MAGRIASLSTFPSASNGSSLEAWYPNTAPSSPTRLLMPTSGLTWGPSRVPVFLETTLQESPAVASRRLSRTLAEQPAPSPFHGSLRYHSDIGWHYRYLKSFRIVGKPYPPSLVAAGLGAKSSGPWRWEPEDLASEVGDQAQGGHAQGLRVKDRGVPPPFLQIENVTLNFSCHVKLRRADRASGFYRALPSPWVRLRRIEQRSGFGCLLGPLKVMQELLNTMQ